MPLSITDVFIEWLYLEGGLVIARVTAELDEVVVLTGIPQWFLIDGLGNNHKAYNASPHIQPTDDLVNYVVALFRCQPAFADWQLQVTADDHAVEALDTSTIPGGDYPTERR